MSSALAAAQAGDYQLALTLWEPLAHAGNARAQNNIAACFAEGLGVARNLVLAVKWLTPAANAGDPVAQRNLATLYFKGEGVEPDELRAAALYRSAAEQGDGPAQDMLSWMLLEGEGIQRDVAEARRFAVEAATQGIASSMTRMGMNQRKEISLASIERPTRCLIGAPAHSDEKLCSLQVSALKHVTILRMPAGVPYDAARGARSAALFR